MLKCEWYGKALLVDKAIFDFEEYTEYKDKADFDEGGINV